MVGRLQLDEDEWKDEDDDEECRLRAFEKKHKLIENVCFYIN